MSETNAGTAPLPVYSHVNSEGERITCDRVMSGRFKGQHLLTIYDDPPSSTRAPMLLDKGTRRWLRDVLDYFDHLEMGYE